MTWIVPDWYQRTPKEEMEGRIERLQALLRENGVEAALIGDTVAEKVDLFYLSGTTQQAHLYVPAEGLPLLLVRKELERARLDSPWERIVPFKSAGQLPDLLREQGYPLPATLGLQLAKVPARAFLDYRSSLGEPRVVDLSSLELLRSLRMLKSPHEVALIRRAARIVDTVLRSIDGALLQEGMREIELAGRLEAIARREGHQGILRMDNLTQENLYGECLSGAEATISTFFDGPLGGWGLSPAMPQSAGFKPIRRGEPIVLDFVGVFNGYVADQTRMAVIGALPPRLARAYEATLEIQEAVIREVRPGARSRELYALAQEQVQQRGYADHFMGYGERQVRFIGHGVGLTMDDLPVITSAKRFDLPLQPGMVIALEPKLVFPGEGAVGIEDTLLVTQDGCEPLTFTGREVIAVA
ncbi:MAG: aminopeptidase P family protein [Candidatus Tectomicrobia bacterium]|uniref:Aminopeptidase P family protein n=1 Tax=Tectimicrobiota bacterium TaxID=2528274 RepID=A0A932CNP7_UNCTE|nr:aminopeptidase P family protein [Candidatus Tectomicrobia bacterium]